MHLRTLVETSLKVGASAGRKEKIGSIAELLARAQGKEIALAAYYLAGRLPQGKLGIGWRLLEPALRVPALCGERLHLHELDERFKGIAGEQGPGATGRKARALMDIFACCNEKERNFLAGLIMGELRQGAMEGLVLEALALAAALPNDQVRQAFMFSGDIGEIAMAAMEGGGARLAEIGPVLFQPVASMLASPAQGAKEALQRLGEAAFEYKIDGARVQIHKRGDRIAIFSRNLHDVTRSIPEVVAFTVKLPIEEAILEAEVIALSKEGVPLAFQTTMRRFGRIRDVSRLVEQIPLSLFFFDLLYLDGKPLFNIPYARRMDALAACVPLERRVPRIITAEEKEVLAFFKESLRAGHEGIMAKKLDSPYRAGQRGFLWLKIKQAQTLDLVVLAAEWGHGRRRGKLSNLHLGARDPSGGFVMLGKTFKGLTDKMLLWQTKALLDLEVGRDPNTVYVRPGLVVEVAFSDVQESPRYPEGLALRFARVKGFRLDKTPADADTVDAVRRIFESSRTAASGKTPAPEDNETH